MEEQRLGAFEKDLRGEVNNMALYNFYLSPDISRNEDGSHTNDQEMSNAREI
jgi:hypothetical protein